MPTERLRSYSRLDETDADVWTPADVAELASMLSTAKANGRKATIRAGGWSLHDQSLNHDVVIDVSKLRGVESIDVAAREVTVQAATPWRQVVTETLAQGLVPYVVPTGEGITCGGSLASDGISRYSPSYASESSHVLGLWFLEVGATAERYLPRPAPTDHGPDAKLFRALIGGFGYLGVVTKITYRLLDVSMVDVSSPTTTPPMVSTTLETFNSFEKLLDASEAIITDDVQTSLDYDYDGHVFPAQPDRVRNPSVYAVAMPHKKDGRGAVFRSYYSRSDSGKPYILYQPRSFSRKLMTWILTSSLLKKLINDVVYLKLKIDAGKTFVNDLFDYMFFMEGEVIGKEWVEDKRNAPLPVLQQTYVVAHGASARSFMRRMTEVLADHGIEPTLFEFLYMPKDDILMSASNGMAGYAITIAFQDIESERRQRKAIAALKEIARECHHGFGGRIHLTKNVYADPAVIDGMYGAQATAFLALKALYDPDDVLRNCFFERVFPNATNAGSACPGGPREP